METPTPPDAPPRRQRKGLRPWQYILIGVAIPIVALIGLQALMAALFQLGDPGRGGSGGQDYVVTKVALQATITLPGTVEPTQRLDLSFASEGDVTHVGVAVGDAVGPGSVLATIDDTELRAATSDASAEADAAWKDYQSARKSGQSAAINAMRSAHAVKAQALKDARAALEKATLTSTIDGVVAAVNVQRGDRAGGGGASGVPGAQPWSGSGADVVVISRTFQVKATVGSAERFRVTKGMTATVRPASSATPLRGTVTALGVVAETTQQGDRPTAASFPLTVTLEDEPTDVFAGASATIEIHAGGGGLVLAVPQAAVMDRMSETQGTVLVRRGAEPAPVQVTLGASWRDLVEVVSGLEEGDVVVVPGGGPDGSAVPVEASGAQGQTAGPRR